MAQTGCFGFQPGRVGTAEAEHQPEAGQRRIAEIRQAHDPKACRPACRQQRTFGFGIGEIDGCGEGQRIGTQTAPQVRDSA